MRDIRDIFASGGRIESPQIRPSGMPGASSCGPCNGRCERSLARQGLSSKADPDPLKDRGTRLRRDHSGRSGKRRRLGRSGAIDRRDAVGPAVRRLAAGQGGRRPAGPGGSGGEPGDDVACLLAAIELLPPRQRAMLILRDVVRWPAAEVADLLDTSVSAVNSALQRARATLRDHWPGGRLDWAPATEPDSGQRRLLRRFIAAHEQGDPEALIALLRHAVRLAISPQGMERPGRSGRLSGTAWPCSASGGCCRCSRRL